MMPSDPATEFIDQVADCIAEAGAQNHSLGWWATWTSSKNRFLSDLTPYFEDLFEDRPEPREPARGPRYVLALLSALARSAKAGIVYLRRIAKVRRKLGEVASRAEKDLAGKRIYLIKTFAYAHSFEGKSFRDPFFGALPEHLKAKGRAVLTIHDPIDCIDQSIDFAARSSEPDTSFALPYLVFSRKRDVFFAWGSMISGFFRMKFKGLTFASKDVTAAVRRQCRVDLLGSNALFSFLLYAAFRRIARSFSLDRLLITLENNPWERLCQIAVRETDPRTVVIGYQHAVVPQSSLNMFPGRGEKEYAPVPDRTLTTGEEPARILARYGRSQELGGPSPTPACALRFQYLETLVPRSGPVAKTLLVAMEGTTEAAAMLDHALSELGGASNDWTIIARTHPALPLEKMGLGLKEKISKLPNVRVSQGTPLRDDLEKAGVVLYWGSSVGAEALKLGLPVIHFDTGRILSYDPLFSCTHLKWTTSPGTSLRNLLAGILTTSPVELESERAKARAYIDSYFFPVTPEALDLFLGA